MGYDVGKRYYANKNGLIVPDYKMFINVARKLNITCPQMIDTNFYEQGRYRYVLLKTAYSFKPGESVECVASLKSTFTMS
jgi:hypothetical protein